MEIYQFKITLKDSKPPIWRRIQVLRDSNFHHLHLAIQLAMGWQSVDYNYHLHNFRFHDGSEIGIVGTDSDDEDYTSWGTPKVLDEKVELISGYFNLNSGQKRAIYTYDFGDNWKHEILLEKVLPGVPGQTYPKCTGGKRACPPEDVGGLGGYYDFLETVQNPQHKEYEEMKDWAAGIGYQIGDPAIFNKTEVDFSQMN